MIKNTIDVIIPTMWKENNFCDYVKHYIQSDHIRKIIIVDNNHTQRPKSDILYHQKIELVSYRKNIYVNPAWNEGYYRSDSDIMCILNDDISVDNSIFEYMSNLDFSEIDIIGVHLKGSVDNYHIVEHPDQKEELIRLKVDKTKPIGGQSYAFGVCMFIKRSSYRTIPSLYKIWYGDDYLIQRCENIFTLKTSKIKGEISKTIVAFDKDNNIKKQIILDSKNVYRFNHFLNSKNWDLVKGYSKQTETIQTNKFLLKQYEDAVKTPSDINQNLHILKDICKNCSHVTEMGVRSGVSTRAFLSSDVTLKSYDIILDEKVSELFKYSKSIGKNVEYIKADVLNIEIEETDFLFIDTYHVYGQLKKELALHGNKAKKYIGFHDTYTFGLKGENPTDNKGLLSAIIEFMIENPQWIFKINKTNNNGMIILEKRT
jgi:hypothetical protein